MPDGLLPSSKLFIDQISAKFTVIDWQINVAKLLYGS